MKKEKILNLKKISPDIIDAFNILAKNYPEINSSSPEVVQSSLFKNLKNVTMVNASGLSQLITFKGFILLSEIVSTSSTIQNFDVSNNDLNTDLCIQMAKIIRGAYILESFNISYNNIGEGGLNFLNILKYGSKLKVLDISFNYLHIMQYDISIVEVAQVLVNIPLLKYINMKDNHYTEEDADYVSWVSILYNKEITNFKINLEQNILVPILSTCYECGSTEELLIIADLIGDYFVNSLCFSV